MNSRIDIGIDNKNLDYTADKTPAYIIIISLIIATVTLGIDLIIPLGVAAGVPYIALVFMGTWYSRFWHTYLLAVAGSMLTIIGYLMSPEGGIYWMVLLNRILALMAIWTVAFLVVTSRKQAEKRLESSEQRFLDVARASTDWFWEMGPDLRFCYFSERFSKATGISSKGIIGTRQTDHTYIQEAADEAQKWNHHIETLKAHKPFSDFEYDVKRNDGTICYVRTSGTPVFTADGNFQGYRGTGTNITGRKETENRLHRQNIIMQKAEQVANFGYWMWDEVNHRCLHCSDGLAHLRGMTVEKYMDLMSGIEADRQRVHPDDAPMMNELWKRIRMLGEQYSAEYRIKHTNGEVRWVQEVGAPLEVSEARVVLTSVGITYDITEQKQRQKELRILSRAVEHSSSAVIIVDLDGTIEYINSKFSEITGYSSKEVIGKTPRLLISGETTDLEYIKLWKMIRSGEEWKGELHNCRKDGSFYWSRNSISPVKNEDGVVTHYISIHDDVTDELELKQQLSYQASHDSLTGLINRAEFERRAERLLASSAQNKEEHALCFMDLDQFKVINDTCGHTAGDELLRQLGKLLQGAVRHRDTLARLGGDEFGVLMEHCTLEQASRLAESLECTIKDFNFAWEERSFRIGVSIGLVAINQSTPNFTELLKRADAACYMAKDLGRNRIHVYHPEDSELAQRHGEMQWVARINQALEDDRYCLYAQPILPLTDSKHLHYEMLLRMIDETGEVVAPGAFLPAAERYDLIGNLDRWVVENALDLLVENPAFVDGIHFISINLSGSSLTSGDFLDFIMGQLKKTRIEAGKVCFEITETVAISNLAAAKTFITVLQEIGCHFALDDFGSGLSSFGYLKNLPVDYLKIDGMFVKDIVDDPIDRAMVKSINDVGQIMGMQTIAEFVENDEIKGILKEIGVNYAQGYGLGIPLPFDEVIEQSIFNV